MERNTTQHTSRIRGLAVVAAAIAVSAVSPALASAAPASVGGNDENSGTPLSSDVIEFIDYDANHVNDLTVTFDASAQKVTFHDQNQPVEKYVSNYQYSNAFTQCFELDSHTVQCQTKNVEELRMWTFGGNDVVHVEGDPIKTTIYGGEGIDTIYGGAGEDQVDSGPGNDWVFGRDGDDTLAGGADQDWIVGHDGNDELDGGDGADKLDGDVGNDDIHGGPSSDTVDYHYYTSPIEVSLDDQFGDGKAGESDNVRSDVEHISAGSGADHLYGSAADNIIKGNGGADVIYGFGGEDVLFGGALDDHLYGGNGGDDIRGETGADSMFGGNDDDVMLGSTGADTHDGGPGVDGAQYWDRTNKVAVTIGDGQANDGEAGEGDSVLPTTENAMGGKGDDELVGDAGNNYLLGYEGNDTITAGLGNDTLDGDKGDDRLNSKDGLGDVDKCGAGNDTVDPDGTDTLSDCETSLLATNNGQGNGNGQGGQQQIAGPTMKISSKAKVAGGKAKVTLKCPKTAKVRCIGTLKLTRSGKKVGSKKFSIKAGKSAVVKVKLASKARKVLVSKGKSTIKASASAKDSVSQSKTTTGKVKLKLAK